MRTLSIALGMMMLAAGAAAEDAKPLKALLITGGGYHDYNSQKKILTEGISARANVEWTVVLENPKAGAFPQVFAKPDWIKGYDVIVHNQCFAKFSEVEAIDKIVKQHLDAEVGVLMIHCAMHAFRDSKTKEWDKLVGVESRRHGAKFPIIVRNLGPEHPVTKNLPRGWTTPMGELYHTSPLPIATQLGVGFREGQEAQSKQTCVWTNTYGKCKVFGTTLGHHNETMKEKVYLDMVANGLLWSCGKLDDSGKPAAGFGKTASVAKPVRFQVMLSNGRVLKFPTERAFAAAGLHLPSVPCCGNE
ncbi:MAG: ThuA domain-containing protein [Planctomycetales bacterium]